MSLKGTLGTGAPKRDTWDTHISSGASGMMQDGGSNMVHDGGSNVLHVGGSNMWQDEVAGELCTMAAVICLLMESCSGDGKSSDAVGFFNLFLFSVMMPPPRGVGQQIFPAREH